MEYIYQRTSLERDVIKNDLKNIILEIKNYLEILNSREKLLSIISGLVKTAINGNIDATPSISITAIIKIKISKKYDNLLSDGVKRSKIFNKLSIFKFLFIFIYFSNIF